MEGKPGSQVLSFSIIIARKLQGDIPHFTTVQNPFLQRLLKFIIFFPDFLIDFFVYSFLFFRAGDLGKAEERSGSSVEQHESRWSM